MAARPRTPTDDRRDAPEDSPRAADFYVVRLTEELLDSGDPFDPPRYAGYEVVEDGDGATVEKAGSAVVLADTSPGIPFEGFVVGTLPALAKARRATRGAGGTHWELTPFGNAAAPGAAKFAKQKTSDVREQTTASGVPSDVGGPITGVYAQGGGSLPLNLLMVLVQTQSGEWVAVPAAPATVSLPGYASVALQRFGGIKEFEKEAILYDPGAAMGVTATHVRLFAGVASGIPKGVAGIAMNSAGSSNTGNHFFLAASGDTLAVSRRSAGSMPSVGSLVGDMNSSPGSYIPVAYFSYTDPASGLGGNFYAPTTLADTYTALTGFRVKNPSPPPGGPSVFAGASGTLGDGSTVVGGIVTAVGGALPGTGTVTSIDVSGGTTGLTFTGGPVTTAGTITMAGTLAVTNGGTGATTASGARSNLGLGTAAVRADTYFLQAGNNLSDLGSASTARTNLGLGTMAVEAAADYLTKADNLASVADAATARTNLGLGTAATHAEGDFLQAANNLSDLADAGAARSNLGLGSLATRNTAAAADIDDGAVEAAKLADGAVDLAGSKVTGTLPIANGGTNATSEADARTNLDVYSKGESDGAFAAKAANLSDLSDAAAARSNLGLGSLATEGSVGAGDIDDGAVDLGGPKVTGTLPVGNGGTGAADAPTARGNLGFPADPPTDGQRYRLTITDGVMAWEPDP